MDPIVYRITLDLAKSGVQHVLSGFKVGDTNRKLEIRLTNGGTPYEIEHGTVAQIRATLPNGSQFASICEVSDNTVAYAVEKDLVSVGGEIKADIQLGNAIGETFSTSEILLLVYPSEIEGDTSLEDNFKTVLQAVAKTDAAADRANTEADNAKEAADLADTAAGKAQSQAESAKEAADLASKAADNAKEAADAISNEINLLYKLNEKISQTANALEGTASGEACRLDDVSPIEHEMKVTAKQIQSYEIGALLASNENVFTFGLETGKYYTVLVTGETEETTRVLAFSYNPIQYAGVILKVGKNEEEFAAFKTLKAGDVLYYGSLDGSVEGLYHTKAICFDGMMATVKKYGKNLYHNTATESYWLGGAEVKTTKDLSSVVINGTVGSTSSSAICKDLPIKVGAYVISVYGLNVIDDFYIQHKNADGTTTVDTIDGSKKNSKIFTTDKDRTIEVCIAGASTSVYDNKEITIQIEQGTTATEYEPYKDPVIYTSDENGIVEGVTSLHPTATLVAEEGVIITAQYNRDIGKFARELSERIERTETGLDTVKKLQTDLISQIEAVETEAAAGLETVKNSVSNALQGKVRGKAITISDISPIEHIMKVSTYPKGSLFPDGYVVRYTKNYIPSQHEHPSGEKTTIHGVTFVDNGENVITANGTNSGDITSNYYPYNDYLATPIPAGNYILYGCGAGDNEYVSDAPFKVRLFLWDEEGNRKEIVSNLASKKISFTLEKPITRIQVRIQIMQGVTVKNQTFYTFLFNEEDGETYNTGFLSFTEKTNEVPSAYPEVYLLPKEEGSTVDVEYNRDINKAFAALSAAILNT